MKPNSRLILAILCVALAVAIEPLRASDVAPANGATKSDRRAAVIFVEGVIDPALKAAVDRRLERILADARYETLIIHTESPGGLVSSSMEIGDAIFDAGSDGKLHTVTWVPREAISGAALTALAARDIYMKTGAMIGDCQPIVMSPDGYTPLGEKIQSPLRQKFENYARRNGYPIPLAQSLVTQEYEIYRVTWDDGRVEWYEKEQLDEIEQQDEETFDGPRYKREKIVSGKELPTWGETEALDYGISRGTFESRDALLESLGYDPATNVDVFPITWSESLSATLLGIRWLLLLVGLGSLYLEFKAPGFGVAGLVGLIAFGLYFFAGYVGGLAENLEIVLFVVGVALIVVELFFIPGFGFVGAAGLGCVVIGLYLAATPFVVPDTPDARTFLYDWTTDFGIGLLGLVVIAILASRYLPHVPLFNRLLLVPPAGDLTGSAATVEVRARPLIGRGGVAETDLRPAGRIKIGDEPYDVITDGRFIPAGTRVEIVEVKSNRILVLPTEERA